MYHLPPIKYMVRDGREKFEEAAEELQPVARKVKEYVDKMRREGFGANFEGQRAHGCFLAKFYGCSRYKTCSKKSSQVYIIGPIQQIGFSFRFVTMTCSRQILESGRGVCHQQRMEGHRSL